ncbi:YheC/YheD family protein [Sulfoacidibacillus thermotolerans]|uniref:ATP-grasp domain-containing protein n=1 Tax=Sulfoacidibacillus thermotolerans TaxID=1765684 RepID=A0A2U3DAE7_SULT2|nr:YheC/YheD family protein [Sulfoacidibacillus thermotolerans]PWI58254.1 hypothetical protein BM613_04830 [Sulfoacidibacillus thermotolerans]
MGASKEYEPFGILTASRDPKRLGGNVAHFRRIVKAAQNQGFTCKIYNLCPTGVMVYRDAGKGNFTRTGSAILPKVLYNRIPTRDLENQLYVTKAVRELQEEGHVIVNPHFLRKDQIAQLWAAEPELSSYVPFSQVVQRDVDILQFAERFPAFYLKPLSGKAGVGIYYVAMNKTRYEVVEQKKGQRVAHGHLTQAQFASWIQQHHFSKRYLQQQAAPVLLYHGRRFDLRMLLHRAQNEDFSITGLGIRVGPDQGITTHVPNGGVIANPSRVLRTLYGDRAHAVEQRARAVAITAAQAIAAARGTWLELSIDMGLTADGIPVLFEANAKPMKFDERAIERRAKERLVHCLHTFSK